MSDFEAWMELCDLYLQEMDYGKAAFCMEELLLANPYSHLVHQKYAEVSKYQLHENLLSKIYSLYYSDCMGVSRNFVESLGTLYFRFLTTSYGNDGKKRNI